ncbi:formylmethanofuran--tetrahydromethanopterin N-formyltransferase [Methanobacterium formicicum]|uniref:Formylmethanofuran--tetrahydromethanopterin formyltransferase n=1 Tax=Methanobacterium formicicum (strain DSM 3637 / PP1) TaxID=1204725 RepID=K2QAU6_METFP|nr:formylmethanofuran--tetrahydromethanopterin N-formyltransferase [Methanobacterium formicicum]EKF85091.1 formylmethanofuran--tetrahydromethanopterin formyltransferase [Methanobacterium formicicum DSM 3637]
MTTGKGKGDLPGNAGKYPVRIGKIEDTYAEAFNGICCRVIVTADDDLTLQRAAYDATSTPGTVIGRVEGGVEGWLNEDQTPDHRKGAILQFWYNTTDIEKFQVELSYRIRQDILVKPFTSVFDASINPSGYIDTMKYVGHCGDGYEWEEEIYGRHMIVVPIAIPDFLIERKLGYTEGIMGANFWYYSRSKEAVLEGGRAALKAIESIEGVITPFDICSAASKPETNYPWIGPTTNHPYCPTLQNILGGESQVPEGVNYIPEIVLNGLNLESLKKAMKIGIEVLLDYDDVMGISAGNYDGKLGDHQIHLKELFP